MKKIFPMKDNVLRAMQSFLYNSCSKLPVFLHSWAVKINFIAFAKACARFLLFLLKSMFHYGLKIKKALYIKERFDLQKQLVVMAFLVARHSPQ